MRHATMKKKLLSAMLAAACIAGYAQKTDVEVMTGSYKPEWSSLNQWECPEWFMDAKFGIWAHWGPQCHAEAGDWYARFMYYMGSGQQNWHWEHFGDPAEFGLKELCNDWKAQNWNPEKLIELYHSVGARYFMALGNHHDNFDLWNSPYQEWNSVNMGPKRDLLKEWSDACKKVGLPLGVSMHASHAWTWLEPSQEYDGNLTKEDGYTLNADGTEKWWKGYDPQELYAQNHIPSNGWRESGTIHSQWEWGNGASLPSEEYKLKFQNRVLQCINDYAPDMIYFDDTAMPFYGCDDNIGKNILTHYYNKSAAQNGGTPQVVVTGKQLDADQKKYMLWDVERGIPDRMQEKYWQTCTCIGSWHYDQGVYNNNGYKSAALVVRMLVDIVSKNGNLLLSVPIKSDGTIDEKEEAVLADIKAWMDINSESVYGTRTWKTFGEGPLAEASNPMNAQGFNEGQNYSARDVRYVQKDGKIYATIMAWPSSEKFTFESFSITSEYYSGKVTGVELLGYGSVEYTQGINGLTVTLPAEHPNEIAPVLAITTEEVSVDPYEELQAVIEAVATYLNIVAEEANLYNTGKPSLLAIPTLREALEKAKEVTADVSGEETTAAKEALLAAYRDFKANGVNKGGKFKGEFSEDLTAEMLIEANAFTREAGDGLRFGKPYYWTVENFSIPNGNDGVKQGLDSYSGNDALMLGVWNDAANNQEGDLANARIYRKIHLDAGKYYFGAGYNTRYGIGADAYMFVSTALTSTADIPDKSIAYYPIINVTEDRQLCGLWFKLEEEQDVYIGFQADLSGASTQEFRAEQVALYLLPDENLEEFLFEMDATLAAMEDYLGENTGYYDRTAWESMFDQCYAWMDELATLTPEEQLDLYYKVKTQWEAYLATAKIQGGAPANMPYEDITVEYLVEASDFTRAEGGEQRFGKPEHWTVENFSIPNGGDGTKQGLDKYEGRDALMLGVWNDAGNNQEGDLSNARIYRCIHLGAGKYYFGAAFNACYQVSPNAYMFVSTELYDTDLIPGNATAYYALAEATNDRQLYGLNFTLAEETDLYIGFQMDLTSGSSTQEIRAEQVALYQYNDMTHAKLQELITSINSKISSVKVSNNTGHYTAEAYETLIAHIADAQAVTEGASVEEIVAAYEALTAAYATFLVEGRIKGTTYDETDATDITEQHLIEIYGFTRKAGGNDRFGSPLYWTVENYDIPSATEGIRGGLDKWPGHDHLTIGVWDDKQNAPETSDITNTRVYRPVTLDAGIYFFGAIYNTIYNMTDAYVFAAAETLPTAEIPDRAIAYMRIAECAADGEYWGIRFTLPETQEVLLGWQADLLNGNNTQEFRAEKVKLAYYGTTAIEDVEYTEHPVDASIYTLQGVKVNASIDMLPRGLYIIGNKKMIVR